MEAKRLAEYEERLQTSEQTRRKLQNLVHELRGNVRVFARVRPYLPHEASAEDPVVAASGETNSVRMQRTCEDGRREEHVFQMDRVFSPSASQEGIFQEVAEFVQAALDGYHVCLLSYGQTGSGKVGHALCCCL